MEVINKNSMIGIGDRANEAGHRGRRGLHRIGRTRARGEPGKRGHTRNQGMMLRIGTQREEGYIGPNRRR